MRVAVLGWAQAARDTGEEKGQTAPLRTDAGFSRPLVTHSAVDPPVPIPNTAVKRRCADGSAALGGVRVGRRQNRRSPASLEDAGLPFFLYPLVRRRGASAMPCYRVRLSNVPKLPGDRTGDAFKNERFPVYGGNARRMV